MEELSRVNAWVLALSFLCAALFGALSHRSHFCTMGALSDWLLTQETTRLRQWVLAIGVAMAGFAGLVSTGTVDPAQTIFSTSKFSPLSAALGGWLFGWGMVLASGCAGKTLVRLGAGNLKSLVVLLVMGVAAFATIKGLFAVWRVSTVDRMFWDLPVQSNLAYVMAWWSDQSEHAWSVGLGLAIGLALTVGACIKSAVKPLWPGLGVGLLVVCMWWITGHLGFITEHPDTLEQAFIATNSKRAESLSFVAPMAYSLDWLMFYSDASKVLTVSVLLAVGVVFGSWVTAVATRTFRWESFRNVEDMLNHLWGAVFMGVGGVTAIGCTIGQGISGIATLNLSSFVVLLFFGIGAKSALMYQSWRMDN
jgi:uncharacterized membrane protein YedE/YeeE